MNSIQLKVLNRLSYELNSAKGAAKQTLMNSIQLKVPNRLSYELNSAKGAKQTLV